MTMVNLKTVIFPDKVALHLSDTPENEMLTGKYTVLLKPVLMGLPLTAQKWPVFSLLCSSVVSQTQPVKYSTVFRLFACLFI